MKYAAVTVRFRTTLFAALTILTVCGIGSHCSAQIPGGVPLPHAGDRLYAAHGQARVGYYLAATNYRFQGEYSLAYNFAQIGSTLFYLFGDVDVEALSNEHRSFLPDRQTGSFEIGARQLLPHSPLTLFYRHQSPHNIDRNDRRQGSWELAGLRWERQYGEAALAVSAGYYVSRIVNDYRWDFDLQADYPLGRILGRSIDLHGDLHQVAETGPRGGFSDLWIEPTVQLSSHLKVFLGVGQVHDIDVFGGRTDQPVIGGIKILW